MDTSSYFIENKCLFGCYPTIEGIKELIREGVVIFVDLTTEHEKIRLNVYDTDQTYISFPIKDRFIPTDLIKFSQFIILICNKIKNLNENEKLYLHCKGGHGRAGLVVSCILSYMYNISGEESIIKTNEFHSNRKNMREKWRELGSPQTYKQKEFIIRMFKPIYITNVHIHNTYYFLNNNALFNIVYKNNVYRNINRCYYSLKNPKLEKKLINCNSLYEFKKLIDNDIDEFKEDKNQFFKNILSIKFKNKKVKDILFRTFLRPLVYIQDDIDLGKIWMDLRHKYILYVNNSII